MNDELKQQVSGLLDDRAEELQVHTMDQILASEALKQTWWRYQLISDVMKQNLPAVIDRSLAARISAIVADEPAVLAPANLPARRYLRPLAGLAIAASVAAVAVIGIRQPDQVTGQQPAAKVADLSQAYSADISSYTFPVVSSVVTGGTDTEEVDELESNSRLNSYLVNYNEFRAAQTGVQGMNPYVRIIANEEGK